MNFKNFKLLLFSIISLNAFSMDSHDELIRKFLEQRKQMMQEMMEAFHNDDFFSDDHFMKDSLFDKLRKEGLGGFGAFQHSGSNVMVEEKMNKDGSIDVVITPQADNIDLDIETSQNRINIKSEIRQEQKDEQEGMSTQSISMQSFSKSISIPEGYEARPARKEDKSIIITLFPSEKNELIKETKDGLKPIKPRKGEKVI